MLFVPTEIEQMIGFKRVNNEQGSEVDFQCLMRIDKVLSCLFGYSVGFLLMSPFCFQIC
jgi:hypothetical protein